MSERKTNFKSKIEIDLHFIVPYLVYTFQKICWCGTLFNGNQSRISI